jgi:hypothetical protein
MAERIKKLDHDQKGRWPPGVSGNPGGRPRGARNKTTIAAMALLEGQAEMLTQRAIDAARDGDMSALKLVLDRIIPPRRRPFVQLDLDKLDQFQDSAQAHRHVVQAALDGGLSFDEAERLSRLVFDHMRASDIAEFEWRANRYIDAIFRRVRETQKRLKEFRQAVANGDILREDSAFRKDLSRREQSRNELCEQPEQPEDSSTEVRLFIAALAYSYDCEKQEHEIERAWSALPESERKILREAQRYFTFIEIPEEKLP